MRTKVRKLTAIAAILLLCISVLVLTGCGKEREDIYIMDDYSEYVTLPDYSEYTVDEIKVNITESKINAEIDDRLQSAEATEEVTTGTVDEGDTVTISFKGTLADGTTSEGMQSDSYELVLGSGGMIDGFEEGIYGAKIGETRTLQLQFPDPYENGPELAGQDVSFEIKVINKKVDKPASLNEEFVKANSEVTTVAEYKELIKKELEEQEYADKESNAKVELFNRIVEEAEVKSVPDTMKEYEKELWMESYEANYADSDIDWDDFLESMQMNQEEFDEQLDLYGSEMARMKLIAYALADKEGFSYTDDEVIERLLAMSGAESEKAFESTYGVSADVYAASYNSYGLKVSMLLDASLDKIYDSLTSK